MPTREILPHNAFCFESCALSNILSRLNKVYSLMFMFFIQNWRSCISISILTKSTATIQPNSDFLRNETRKHFLYINLISFILLMFKKYWPDSWTRIFLDKNQFINKWSPVTTNNPDFTDAKLWRKLRSHWLLYSRAGGRATENAHFPRRIPC